MDINQLRALPIGTDLEVMIGGSWVPCKLAETELLRNDGYVTLGMNDDHKGQCWPAAFAADVVKMALQKLNMPFGYFSAAASFNGKNYVRLLAEPTSIAPSHDPSGLSCSCCQEFYHMAVANRPEGKLVCYSCRSTRPWL